MADKDLNLDDLRARVDIVSLVSEYVHLTRAGSNYKGICPFHKDKHPSLMVSQQKQIFKCFVCNVGGDAIKFLSLAENISYRDAMYQLADKLGIEYLKGGSEERDREYRLRQDIISLNHTVAKFYYEQLKLSEKAQKYLKERKLQPSTVTKFGLGYSPDSRHALADYLIKTGVKPELMVTAGIAVKKEYDNGQKRYYDRFFDRLMFPIIDDRGNVIGFGGRIMEKKDDIAKYINSAETPAYSKGRSLYGLNVAKLSGSKRVIIVEGYMDCIALHQKDINFAVASLGTALTENQAKLLKKYFEEAIIAYDADDAGQMATVRGMDILKKAGFSVKVFRLQGAKDADEYLRTHKKEDFIAQLDNSQPLNEYKIDLIAKQFPPGDNDRRVRFVKAVRGCLGTSDVERDIYADWTFKKYGKTYGVTKELLLASGEVTDELINDSLKQVKKFGPSVNEDVKSVNISKDQVQRNFLEKSLLIILSEDATLRARLGEQLNDSLVVTGNNPIIYKRLLEQIDKGEAPGSKFLMDGGADDSDFAAILFDFIMPENPYKSSVEIINRLKKIDSEARRQEIVASLAMETDPKKKRELISELQKLSTKQ